MATRHGQVQSLLLATILAVGAGVAWGVAVAILSETVAAIFPDCGELREKLNISIDGTPFVDSLQDDAKGRIFRNLEGNRIKAPATSSPPMLQSSNQHFRNFWSRWMSLHNFNGAAHAYFVHDGTIHSRGYIVGYDTKTKLPAVYGGRNGFRSDKPTLEEQFPVDGQKIADGRALASRWAFE